MSEVFVEMRAITKRFPGITANDEVDFRLYKGEIHALLGENGAGKSTLMSILSGFYRPDSGEVLIRGKRVNFRSPREALQHGIGMVHQHFRLVGPFSVAENIILGTTGRGQLYLNRRELVARVTRFAQDYGLSVDPGVRVEQLSVGEKQRIEILKLLYRGADVLILDEPTAVLTPQNVRELFQALRQMADNGRSIILITHKLQEVMEIADRITVLRKGRNAGTVLKKDVDERGLTRMMVGREVLMGTTKPSRRIGPPVLRLEDINVVGERGLTALKGLTLEVHAGEILGVAGIAGNGQRELAEAVTGLRPVAGGRILVGGRDLTNKSAFGFIEAGVGCIPDDRLGTGLVPNLNLYDNAILKDYRRPPIRRGPFLNRRLVEAKARRLVDGFRIQVSDPRYPVRMMSGGNLQKLLLAREMSSQPKVLVASYPVRGLDIGATETVYRLLLELSGTGTAILLISEDLDELIAFSDRIAVLFRGELVGLVSAREAEVEKLGLMMLGIMPGEGRGA